MAQGQRAGRDQTQTPEHKQIPGTYRRKRQNMDARNEAEIMGIQDLEELSDLPEVEEEQELSSEEARDDDAWLPSEDEEEEDVFTPKKPFLGKGFSLTWLWMGEHLVWCLPWEGRGRRGFDGRDGYREKLEDLFRRFEEDQALRSCFGDFSAPSFFRHMLVAEYFCSPQDFEEAKDKVRQKEKKAKEKAEKEKVKYKEKTEAKIADEAKTSCISAVASDLDDCGIALWGHEDPFMEVRELLRPKGSKEGDSLPSEKQVIWLKKRFPEETECSFEDAVRHRYFWRDHGEVAGAICAELRSRIRQIFEEVFGPSMTGAQYLPEISVKSCKDHWRDICSRSEKEAAL